MSRPEARLLSMPVWALQIREKEGDNSVEN